MSTIITKMLFTVVIGAIGAITAYLLTKSQANEPHQYQPGARSRRRRPSVEHRQVWDERHDKNDDDTDTRVENNQEATTTDRNICTICLEKFEDLKRLGHEIHSTLCGHIFCKKCIRTALRQSAFCPTCRNRCDPASTHPIFF